MKSTVNESLLDNEGQRRISLGEEVKITPEKVLPVKGKANSCLKSLELDNKMGSVVMLIYFLKNQYLIPDRNSLEISL